MMSGLFKTAAESPILTLCSIILGAKAGKWVHNKWLKRREPECKELNLEEGAYGKPKLEHDESREALVRMKLDQEKLKKELTRTNLAQEKLKEDLRRTTLHQEKLKEELASIKLVHEKGRKWRTWKDIKLDQENHRKWRF